MKFVYDNKNKQGFTESKIYQCLKCSTETTKMQTDKSDIVCPYCDRRVKLRNVKK